MSDDTTRRGKIARLPERLRIPLNLRLLDGEPGNTLLPWLNAQPETAEVLAAHFDGDPITDNNLSNWRAGGFADWRKKRERVEQTKELAIFAADITRAGGARLAEGAAAILGGKVLQILEAVAAPQMKVLIAGEDGVLRIAEDEESEGITLKVIVDMTNAVATLRHGDQQNAKLKLLEEKLKQTGSALEIATLRFHRETAELFEKWHGDKRAIAILDGKAAPALKREQLIELMFGPRPGGPKTYEMEAA